MVSVRVIRGSLVGALRAEGDICDLARALRIEPASLDDPDGYLPQRVWRDLWIEVERRTGDPQAGLHAAVLLTWGHFDVIDYVTQSTGSLGSAVRAFARYMPILNSATEIVVREAEGYVAIERRQRGDEALAMPRHAAEFGLACTVLRFRQASARDWRPLRVTLRHSRPASDTEHRRIFGCPVEFASNADAFYLDRRMMECPMKAADPALCALVERHAQDLLDRLPKERSLLSDVRRALGRELTGGEPTLGRVATALAMGERTLQRRLREESTSFAAQLDEMRCEMAMSYLSSPQMSIAEVGFLLGYSETSAFHRAFRAWTGQTPASFRFARCA